MIEYSGETVGRRDGGAERRNNTILGGEEGAKREMKEKPLLTRLGKKSEEDANANAVLYVENSNRELCRDNII